MERNTVSRGLTSFSGSPVLIIREIILDIIMEMIMKIYIKIAMEIIMAMMMMIGKNINA